MMVDIHWPHPIRRSQSQERSTPQIQAVQSPTAYLRWAVRAGLVCAFALALALTAIQLDVSRDCRGGFSRGFSSGFDIYRCELLVRKIGTNAQFRIPLP
jgi:hypothetical protein